MKWNESSFRPPLCTHRLNWARRTSWGWWDEWDDTVLQTQDSKFEPWRPDVEHATSRSRRLPTILTFTRGWGRNIFVSFKPPRPGTEPRTLAWKAAVLTTTLGPPPNSAYGQRILLTRLNCSFTSQEMYFLIIYLVHITMNVRIMWQWFYDRGDVNPWSIELFNLNFQAPEVVSRYRETRLQVTENSCDLCNLGSNIISVIEDKCLRLTTGYQGLYRC